MAQTRFVSITATIAAGEALSDVIDCSAGAPVFLHMPQGWTPARISFQVSHDGSSFNDLFDSEAHEITFNVMPGTSLRLDKLWEPVTYLKLRSGSRSGPVAQQVQRGIVVTVDTSAQPVTT